MRYQNCHLILLTRILLSSLTHIISKVNNIMALTQKPSEGNLATPIRTSGFFVGNGHFITSLQRPRRLSKVTHEPHYLQLMSPSQLVEKTHSPFLTAHTFFCDQSLYHSQEDELNHSLLLFQTTRNVTLFQTINLDVNDRRGN